MDKNQTITTLQAIVTGLTQQSLSHNMQSKVFAAQGFSKLGEKYADHATEEMDFVNRFIDRIIDLGGQPQLQTIEAGTVHTNVVDWLKADQKESVEGIALVENMMLSGIFDFTSLELMKEYLADEEEDLGWTEQQLELIELIGLQNWLAKQL